MPFMLGQFLILALFVLGAVTTFSALSRSQHQARALEAERAKAIEAQVNRIRGAAEDDVTSFGEALRQLDLEVAGSELSDEARQDWSHALDCYDRAKTLLAQDKGTGQVTLVTEALEEGRHAIACVKARAAGQPVPQMRPPCFFDPAHGPSTTDIMWAPDGGVARKVPACQADATRVQQGRSPWIRTVAVNGSQVPYWQAGQDYAPWIQGYYRRYETNPVVTGLAIGGLGALGLGLFGALFDDGPFGP